MRLSALVLCPWLFLLLESGHWISTVDAAHSRVQNVVRRDKEPPQDQSIATFSSEGRLLQVEYGHMASQKGSAAAVLTSDSGVHILVKSPHKVFVIDEHVIMVASGLLGDARWLARVLRQYCQYHRIQQGESPTLRDIGQYAASDIYHMLTRREGSRPLGCTAILVGSEKGLLPIQVGQGGAVDEASILTTGKGHDLVFKAISNQIKAHKGEGEEHNMLRAAIQAMELKDKETVAVWTIKPQTNGNKHVASCFLNVDKSNCMSI
jgi:20S proteasome alpha/beta subunit